MRRYTVGVAGVTVNHLSNDSGGSTPSRRTNLPVSHLDQQQ